MNPISSVLWRIPINIPPMHDYLTYKKPPTLEWIYSRASLEEKNYQTIECQ